LKTRRLLTWIGVALAASSQLAFSAANEAAYTALVDGYFEAIYAAQDDCAGIVIASDRWVADHSEELDALVAVLVDEGTALSTPEALNEAQSWYDAAWDRFGSNPKLMNVGLCMKSYEGVKNALGEFDARWTRPLEEVLETARARIVGASAVGGPGNLDVARLAAQTLARTLVLYTNLVNAYDGDCVGLANALNYWHGNYFELLDEASQDVLASIPKMSREDYTSLSEEWPGLEAAQPAFDKVAACVDKLEGKAQDHLRFQHEFLANMIVDKITHLKPSSW